MFPYTLLTTDFADDRSREIGRTVENHRLVALARAGQPPHRSIVRRPVAQAVAVLSLGAAVVVRRLDECVADDLGRTLAPTE